MFRESLTHTLLQREFKCWTLTILYSLHSVYRYLYPHTERQIIGVPHIETHHLFLHCCLLTGIHLHTLGCKDEDHHILSDIAWWVQCWTGTDVSGLSCINSYLWSHSHRHTKKPSHTDTCCLMQLMLNNSMCMFF